MHAVENGQESAQMTHLEEQHSWTDAAGQKLTNKL